MASPVTAPVPGLWIAGLGAQYPPYLQGPEKLDAFAKRFADTEKPGLKKLLAVNKATGIDTRATIRTYESGFACQSEAPSIKDIDDFFREKGVDLAVQACRKALREWDGDINTITHTIGVTCTNQGNPGYDVLVNRKLKLPYNTERILLHGVGCAGGLAILRTAAQIACAATARRKAARILCFACELCTPNARHDLAEAEAGVFNIAGVLFSDAAAAFVLCNDMGMGDENERTGGGAIFQLLEWDNASIPDTFEHMGFYAEATGYRTILTRDVPSYTKKAIKPLFYELLPSYTEKTGEESLEGQDFDWALHPGGEAIIQGAKDEMELTDHHLRASKQIYKTRGNSSSPTVLIVLDLLRSLGEGRQHVVAASFGPGLVIEMAMLKRCRMGPDEDLDDY